MVISDFELFDADPAELYRQLAATGPGIAAVLRTDPVPPDLATSGLRIVQIAATSSPALLADTLIDLVADHRAPLPPLPPEGRALPPPPGNTPPSKHDVPAHRRSRNGWWLLALLIVLLLAALAIHSLATHSATSLGSRPPVGPGRSASHQPSTVPPASRLPPIALPAPLGSVARTVPAATVWIVDPHVGSTSGALHAIVEEVPVALSYQQQYGLSSDRLALSPGGAFATSEEQAAALDRRTGLLSPPITAAAGQPVLALRAAQVQLTRIAAPVDRIVVILTAEPARWAALLPSQTYSHPPVGQPHPETRYYLIPLLLKAASPGTLRMSTAGPHTIAVNPTVRGQLATSLARAFVDGTDAAWPQN